MHKIMTLKEHLLDELEEYADKKQFSMEDLTAIKYLASAADHLCCVVKDSEESEYSSRGMSRLAYRDPVRMSYDDGVEPGRSYRRDRMGRYASRGYSRDDGMADKLREAMNSAPDEHTRSEIQRLISKLENV